MWNCLHVAQAGTNQKFHSIDNGTTRETSTPTVERTLPKTKKTHL